jgi:FMN-dependent NADH-azoreductase
VGAGQVALGEFLDADIVVVGAPMYNFSIPSQLMAWIERLAVAGKTFHYTKEVRKASSAANRS